MMNDKQGNEQTEIGSSGYMPAEGWIDTVGARRRLMLVVILALGLCVLPGWSLLRAAGFAGRAPELVTLPLEAILPRAYFGLTDRAGRPSLRLLPELPVTGAQLGSPAGAAGIGRLRAACGSACGAFHRGAPSILGFAQGKVIASSGASGSEPAGGTASEPNPAPQQGRGMATAGGSNQQIQANNAGSLAGIPGSVVNFTTGALTLAPASGQDDVPLALVPSVTNPTADIFQVYEAGATATKLVSLLQRWPRWGI